MADLIHLAKDWVFKILPREMHLGRMAGPLCPTSEMVPSVISRGTPHQPTREASISEGRSLNEFSQQPVI
jgi:hypothetical protein